MGNSLFQDQRRQLRIFPVGSINNLDTETENLFKDNRPESRPKGIHSLHSWELAKLAIIALNSLFNGL